MVVRPGSSAREWRCLHEFRRRDFVAVIIASAVSSRFALTICFGCNRQPRNGIVEIVGEPITIGFENLKSNVFFAGVVQWQNGSFPSCTRGFDSPHPLISK